MKRIRALFTGAVALPSGERPVAEGEEFEVEDGVAEDLTRPERFLRFELVEVPKAGRRREEVS